jgi:hypothetical protein
LSSTSIHPAFGKTKTKAEFKAPEHKCTFYTIAHHLLSPIIDRTFLRQHPRHIVPDPVIIKQRLDLPNSTDSNILIPQLPLREIHDVLVRDTADDALDLLGAHSATRGHDLSSDVLGHGSSAIEGQEDGGFELGLCAFRLGFGDAVGEAGPLAKGEVDKVVDLGNVFGDKIDAPQTVQMLAIKRSSAMMQNLPSVAIASGEAHEAVGQMVLVDEGAEFAAHVWRAAHRAIPVADNSLRDKRSKVVGVLPAHTFDSNGDIGGRQSVVSNSNFRANEVWLSLLRSNDSGSIF